MTVGPVRVYPDRAVPTVTIARHAAILHTSSSHLEWWGSRHLGCGRSTRWEMVKAHGCLRHSEHPDHERRRFR
jgi:hypothetical protein